jgi:ABC-type spermidine/putrescine transport system permease subunit I
MTAFHCDVLGMTASLQLAVSDTSGPNVLSIFILMTASFQWLALLLRTYGNLGLILCTKIGYPVAYFVHSSIF